MLAVEEVCRQGPGCSLSRQISWTFHFRDGSMFVVLVDVSSQAVSVEQMATMPPGHLVPSLCGQLYWGRAWQQALLPFWSPCCTVRGIPVLGSAMSSPYSIATHGPKSGSDFPSHSSDHSCPQACVHSFFLDGEPIGFQRKVDVGARGAERLPETSVGIKGPALEF